MFSIFVSSIEAQTQSRLATIGVDATLVEVARVLSGKHIGLVIVCGTDGSMAGVISKTDVVRNFGRNCESTTPTMAADVMIRDVTSCRPATSLGDVLSLMERQRFVHIPVVDENCVPSGVVNVGDLLEVLVARGKIDAEHLQNYISGVSYR